MKSSSNMDYKLHPDSKKSSRSIASNTSTITCGVCGSKQYFKTCLHNDLPDPACIPNPEWHHCADAFAKNYRIEPLLSSPSLYAPNVFHSHSSMGVRLLPSSNPCLSKDPAKESVHNSKSSSSQSVKKGKSRPGARPKSRTGHENSEKAKEANLPGEPNCCPIQFQQHCCQNYCRFVPYPYQPLPVPVAHYIPVYIPVAADADSQAESAANQEENESDDDYEKVAKKLVERFDSDNEEANLHDLVNKFDDDKREENDLSRCEKPDLSNSFEENDKDEWSSNEGSWTGKNVKTEMNELISSESNKYKKSDEGECGFKEIEKEEVESLEEKKISCDLEEKDIICPSTPIKMSLNEYDYEEEKIGDNVGPQSESVAESEDGKNSKTRSNDSRMDFKEDMIQDDVDKIMDSLEGIKNSRESVNKKQQDEWSEENNDSEYSEEKFENSADVVLDSKNSYHDGKDEVYKIINVYKKEISNDDGKDDWLDTEEEILSYAIKDSFDNFPVNIQKESEKREANTQYSNKNLQDEEDEDYVRMKKKYERKQDNLAKNIFSPRTSAKLKNIQDQGTQKNKLIYTAIINKKDEKEKGDSSPVNSPRWKDEFKRNGKRPDAKKRWMI